MKAVLSISINSILNSHADEKSETTSEPLPERADASFVERNGAQSCRLIGFTWQFWQRFFGADGAKTVGAARRNKRVSPECRSHLDTASRRGGGGVRFFRQLSQPFSADYTEALNNADAPGVLKGRQEGERRGLRFSLREN